MPVYNPALDVILDLSDKNASGRLALVGSRVVRAPFSQNRRLIRNGNGNARLRFCRASNSGNREFEDVDPAGAIVREAIGIPDQVPTSGTFPLAPVAPQTAGPLVTGKRYLIAAFVSGDSFTNVGAASNATGIIFTATGTTPTTWTHSSALQEITTELSVNATYAEVAAALNATAAITAIGAVSVTSPAAGAYQVVFPDFAAHVAIAGPINSAMSPLSVVSVSRVQPGTTSLHEVQLIRLVANPFCLAVHSTAFPVAAAQITTIQAATTELPAIKRLTLDPAPYDGYFICTLASKPFEVPWDASAAMIEAMVGPDYCVRKVAENAWDFSGVDQNQDFTLTADVTALVVPKGVTGTIALNTIGMHQAFAANPGKWIKLTHEISIQFPGQEPSKVLLEEIEVHRDLLDLGTLVPPTLAGLQFVASNLIGTPWVYTTVITALTGGDSFCLDAVDLTTLEVGTRYDFRISGDSQSWFVKAGDADPGDPTGQVHWVDYNAGSAAKDKHWERGE